MSDYDANRSEEAPQQQDSTSDILGDESGATNTSIVGIVKSRVSSIIPNTLSNWFYPSSPRPDSINGSVGKRHRREEEDADEEVDDDAAQEEEESEPRRVEFGRNLFSQQPDDNSDDSNDSENGLTTSINSRRSLNSRPPPSKRTKLYMDTPNLGDNSLMARQPLVASTPTTSINLRSTSHVPATQAGHTYNRVSYLNQYEKQGTKEPAYNFQESNIKYYGAPFEANNNAIQSGPFNSLGISSRRSLNIPAVSHLPSSEIANRNAGDVRYDLPGTSAGSMSGIAAVGPRRTSTTIEEEEVESAAARSKYNGRPASAFTYAKRQKFINGEEDDIGDSASECGDGGRGEIRSPQRPTGLFNMSAANSRNISRTSSFGNDLNFASHLEGRKSLYSAPQSTQLNKSTLSLNSLNRRQFNASIYGSTSNLSDSRLLNAFSPFYKGTTTYGGAAAYNRYGASGSGAGTNAMRLTPTLIRPTSSLSTRSSSNTSLAAAAANIGGDGSFTTSNTAKRMMDLLNDFPTPIGEAKKMANNHRANEQSRLNDRDLQASRSMRLSHIRTPYSRPAVKLLPTNTNGSNTQLPPMQELQVPSMSQLLQMKKTQATTERSRQIYTENSASIMKSGVTGEYTLPISQNTARESDSRNPQAHQKQQQKHTNKIINKSAGLMRKDVINLDDEAPPPPLVLPTIAFPTMKSVPKIDITIPGPTAAAHKFQESKTRNEIKTEVAAPTTTAAPKFSAGSNKYNPDTTVKSTLGANVKPQLKQANGTITYKFSIPKELKCCKDVSGASIKKEFKFSAPLTVSRPGQPKLKTTTEQPKPAVPQLKTGSVIEALKKSSNFATSSPAVTTAAPLSSGSGFGAKFQKSGGEWDCETCLVRNKQEAAKCVSCETPRKTTAEAAPKSTPLAVNSTPLTSSFGSQFKMSSSEWECDACLLRNKQEAAKCVACTTPRPGSAGVKAPSEISKLPPPVKHTFGDAFKPKANTWECAVCLISNQNQDDACAACGTKKPGSGASSAVTAASSSSFQFGFAAPQKSTSAADEGFKNLAAEQKASKWECEACMTRNDAARLKCACCEQAKPGTQTSNDNAPKFTFGSTAAAKFSFGFGTAAKEEELRKGDSKLTTEHKTLELEKTEPIPVGTGLRADASGSKPSGFTFGLKSTNAPASNTGNTTGDGAGPSNKFKFGSDAAVTSTTGSTFGSPSVSTEKSSETLAPSTTKTSAAPSVKFSLPTTIASFVTSSTSTTKSATTAPLFSIGSAAASGGFGTQAASTTSSEPIITSKPTFSFGTPTTTSALTGPTPSAAIKPTFMFGSASASTTATSTAAPLNTATSTTTSKPVFGTTQSISANPKPSIFASFGSAADAGNAEKASPMAPTSTTFGSFSSANTQANTNVFGTFGSQSDVSKPTAAATPLFGSAASSTSAAPSQTTNSAAATPFVFGAPVAASSSTTTNATTSTFGASASTAWQKESFVFGSTSTPTSNEASKSVFPGFGKPQPTGNLSGQTNSAPSIFSTNPAESATFGNAPPNTGSTHIFAVPSGGNASTGTPAFGSTPFGSGSSTAPPPFQQFSSFGAAASSATSAVDGAPAPKKSEPAFNFGAPGGSSGFNFGSTANKPAFNFTPTAQPAFNFTGGSTNMQPQTAEPFQFGATPSAPVFNFGGGVVETTPNAPFQFSAATTPDTNNIFSAASYRLNANSRHGDGNCMHVPNKNSEIDGLNENGRAIPSLKS